MLISIILPVYNAEFYLSECMDSLISQTHCDFELICIDDGSTDNSLDILKSYALEDERIKVVSRENKGLVYTLNEAIKLAECRYVARMDADDICEKNRLELQLNEMQKNGLAIIGSRYKYIDDEGSDIGARAVPTRDWLIKCLMDYGSPLCHPSVLFDKQLLGDDLVYNKNYLHCEDYELWLRCRSLNYKFGNISEYAFNYRVIESSISRLNMQQQQECSNQLLLEYCSFVNDETEAAYLLGTKKKRNFHMIIKFSFRLLTQLKFIKCVFLLTYLLR